MRELSKHKCVRNKFAQGSRKSWTPISSCVYLVGDNKLHAILLLKDNCAILGVKGNSFQ